MATRQIVKVQFIQHSNVDGTKPAKSQRQVYSHAARIAHARARISRAEKYAREKSLNVSRVNDDSGSNSHENAGKTDVVPNPWGLLSSDRRDPFGSFVVPFKPIEHFLLDHYVRVVVPDMTGDCKSLQSIGNMCDRMIRDWTRFALTDAGFLYGTLLSACRHLEGSKQDTRMYRELATQYKLECVRFVIEALSNEALDKNITFTRILSLAFDEMWIGDGTMFGRHVEGAMRLVDLMGGPKMLMLNGFLEAMYNVCINKKMNLDQGEKPCGNIHYKI
ncbi:unnamed protein product [Periconia digitata]|uniref:Uncharacterized protein n=1 Tax=Periconia digitata TaxID=1303443 RepID=A0A9W4UTV5_9PLEO|nr:unnamed protein product [Periconia digitata]